MSSRKNKKQLPKKEIELNSFTLQCTLKAEDNIGHIGYIP